MATMTTKQAIEAGEAWAQREADAVIDWTRVDPEWTATWIDALPLVAEDVEDRDEVAREIRQAASKEWDRLVAAAAAEMDAPSDEAPAEPAIIEITDGPETMDGYRADLTADWQTYLDAAISALHPDAEVRIIWSADATRIHARAFVAGDERGASAASVALREAVQSQCEDAWDQWCLTVGGAS